MGWVSKNNYLSQSEMENNAVLVCNYFLAQGWTLNAICAMLGNMQSESSINPAIWENLTDDVDLFYQEYNRYPGYGLTQWTPYTKYTEWAGSDWENGDKQCERILYECENGLQWFGNDNAPIVEPPISFKEFSVSTLDIETLANYFLWYYEHPKQTIQEQRAKQAIAWYQFLTGGELPTPKPNRKGLPIWMMVRPIYY